VFARLTSPSSKTHGTVLRCINTQTGLLWAFKAPVKDFADSFQRAEVIVLSQFQRISPLTVACCISKLVAASSRWSIFLAKDGALV